MIRLPETLHAALEAESRETGASKVGIVEDALRARYGIAA